MIKGVIINGTNTLEEWGLMLLADLSVEAPSQKTTFVDVPAINGSINFSLALTGEPIFNRRIISFNLFKSAQDEELSEIKTALMAAYHGREVTLILPFDLEHYFKGVLSVGDLAGFNSGRIPIELNAEPYRYKLTQTVVTKTMTGSNINVTLTNEQKTVVPSFTTTGNVMITFNGNSYAAAAGTHIFPNLKLPAGSSTLTLNGAAGVTVTIKYQEAVI